MAELNTSAAGSGRKATRKRASTRVDLTAMVDLAFLLNYLFYAHHYAEQTQDDADSDAG